MSNLNPLSSIQLVLKEAHFLSFFSFFYFLFFFPFSFFFRSRFVSFLDLDSFLFSISIHLLSQNKS